MTSEYDSTFVHAIDISTREEKYFLQFYFGTREIDIKEDSNIDFVYVHGGFKEIFSREGNDLIIGDGLYYMYRPLLGVGCGKEEWNIVKNEDSTYNINVSKYGWRWNTGTGYYDRADETYKTTMTEEELSEFKAKYNLTLNEGDNTLYTTWTVMPDPEIHYHMRDFAYYAEAYGKLILKNYFLYGQNVRVNGELLSQIIQSNPDYLELLGITSDNIFFDVINGTDKADKIKSLVGDVLIEGGKGNDKITIGQGNKTIVINQNDGKDTIYNFQDADSVDFKFDTDNIKYTKSKNNLIISRCYGNKTEQTVISNYFKNIDNNSKIIISNGDTTLVDDLTYDLLNGELYLAATVKSKSVKGTEYNDEAYSTSKNETFSLGKGNDIIHFKSQDGRSIVPYSFGKDTIKLTKDSHIVLDFDSFGGKISCVKKGDDAILTSRYKIDIAGRDNGKEEWTVKKLKNGSYKITKTEYSFTGECYVKNGTVSEEVWTKSDLQNFQDETGIKLKSGKNVLYTSWAVVLNPTKRYSKTDSANYGQLLGTIVLKNYFKYNEDSVFIGDKSLHEFFADKDELFAIDKSDSETAQTITDTTISEVIKGSVYSDDIISNYGDDRITGGKGNDNITLGEGNKTLYIDQGDGKDTISVLENNTSTNIVYGDDLKGLSFRKSGNNLVINRKYDDIEEHTVIRGYFKNEESNIKIYVDKNLIWDSTKNPTSMVWPVKYSIPVEEITVRPISRIDIEAQAIAQDVSAWKTINDTQPEISGYICYEECDLTVVPANM